MYTITGFSAEELFDHPGLVNSSLVHPAYGSRPPLTVLSLVARLNVHQSPHRTALHGVITH